MRGMFYIQKWWCEMMDLVLFYSCFYFIIVFFSGRTHDVLSVF